jgi:hypothetical protein
MIFGAQASASTGLRRGSRHNGALEAMTLHQWNVVVEPREIAALARYRPERARLDFRAGEVSCQPSAYVVNRDLSGLCKLPENIV